jgi:hypothetical protein
MDAPRYMEIREGYVNGAWSARPSMAMTSEKSMMVITPCRVPITAVVPWLANMCPRRSTGIQHSVSGRVLSEARQAIQPVASSHKKVLARVSGV